MKELSLPRDTSNARPLMDISEMLASLITRPLNTTVPSDYGVDELKTSLGGEVLSGVSVLVAVRLG